MISREDSIETPLLCKLVDVNSYELLLMGRGNNDERREREFIDTLERSLLRPPLFFYALLIVINVGYKIHD